MLDLADAVEVVLHLFLFVLDLPFVGHLLPLAASAKSKVLAHRLHALVRHFLEVQDLAFKEVLFALVDFDVDHVAGHAKGDEDHAPFGFGH